MSSGTLKRLSFCSWSEMSAVAESSASLFVYFKVVSSRAQEARQSLEAMQATLRARHAGLSARLLYRVDEPDDADPTWMEIYESSRAFCDSFFEDLESLVSSLPPQLLGPRHTEAFCEIRPQPSAQTKGD